MGLIIKDKIQGLMKGYPTVSDKYNVKGGILAGSTNVNFGELVKYTSTTGYYQAITTSVNLTDIAGICLATNVKLNDVFPAASTGPVVKPGEGMNLLLSGYVAVEMDTTAVSHAADIVEGANVYVLLASGKFATENTSSATKLPNYVFTGIKETVGGKLLAEIKVCGC